MKKYDLIACFLLTAFALSAQTPKSREVKFLDFRPKLDGQLTDSCWQILEPLDAFSTSSPVFGNRPNGSTELRLFYTQTALYVAAYCFAPEQAVVRRDAGIRDGDLTGDWFRVSLDTWNDDQLAFDFTVSAAGVQQDARQGATAWDAIWQSAVHQQADGWTVEICIPFSALRYPRQPEQTWGAQFSRYERSSGELSTWNPQDPLVQDRVIQFGTLTGIQNIRQLRRRSLAVHSETNARNESDFFNTNTIRQSLGIDGRIGLNESATLDLTLLPAQSYEWGFSSIFPANFEPSQKPQLPEPRQFIAEEEDLFGKNPGMDYSPSVYALDLSWRKPPRSSDESFYKINNGKLLQASKLSARTRGNWRFGVLNALLGPARVEYENIFSNESRKETLQAISDYLFMGAEYLLPNNSFIHLSNALQLSGPGMTTANPQLAFRLRNRSNNLEIAGGTGLPYRHIKDDKFLEYNWNLSLARINRRWGWRLRHFAGNQLIVQPNDNIQPRNYPAFSDARLQYRDFRPRGPFLNLSADATVDANWHYQAHEITYSWHINSNLSALDRNFRRYSIRLYSRPYSQILEYRRNGLHIGQKVSPELGAGFSFQTDNRKRFQTYVSAFSSSGLDGEFPRLFLTLTPSWVIGRRLRLTANIISNQFFQSLTLLSNTSGRWIFERHNLVITEGQIGLDWYPADQLQLQAGIGFNNHSKFQKEAVELLYNGDLQPVDWTFSEPVFESKPTYKLSASYFFSSISQIRFNFDLRPELTYTLPPFPPDTIGRVLNTRLSVIWFIDGTK